MVMRARTAGREVYPRPKRESRKADLALHVAEISLRSSQIAGDGPDITHFLVRISLKGAPQRIDIALEVIE
jgi:hypothetical protein